MRRVVQRTARGLVTMLGLLGCLAVGGATQVPDFHRRPDGVYEWGPITVDPVRRAVTFPAAVNLRAGLVEYAVVTTRGKIHESVFRTEVSPQALQAALLLVGAKAAMTNAFCPDLAVSPPGEPVEILVQWKRRGRTMTRRLEECVTFARTRRALPKGPWVFNGSFLEEGRFAAESEGSIVALQIDSAALVNNPRPGREDDTLHTSRTRALPPEDTLVWITIQRASVPPPKPRPTRRKRAQLRGAS